MSSKKLFKKYKDVLTKPMTQMSEKELNKFHKFLDESSKAGLTDEEVYDRKTNA